MIHDPRQHPDRHAEGWQPGIHQFPHKELPEWLQREAEDVLRHQRRADFTRAMHLTAMVGAAFSAGAALIFAITTWGPLP